MMPSVLSYLQKSRNAPTGYYRILWFERRKPSGNREKGRKPVLSLFLTSHPATFIVFYIISRWVWKKCKMRKETKNTLKKKTEKYSCQLCPSYSVLSCLFELQQMTGVVETSFSNNTIPLVFLFFSFFLSIYFFFFLFASLCICIWANVVMYFFFFSP